MTNKNKTYRVTEEQDEKIAAISKKLDITESEFLRNAIDAYIYEDKYQTLLKFLKSTKAQQQKYFEKLEDMVKIMQEIEKENRK